MSGKGLRRFKHKAPEIVAVVAVVAIAFVGAQRVLADDTSTDVEATQTPAGSTSSTVRGLDQRAYRTGDCISWDQDSKFRERTEIVPCTKSHLLEYTGSVKMDGAFRSYPTEQEWSDFIDRECAKLDSQYLGYAIDLKGRFAPGSLQPLEDAWAQGERNVQCGISYVSPTADRDPDRFEPVDFSAKGQDQSLLYGTGSCVRNGDGGGIVPCDKPHQSEVVGKVEITGTKEFPVDDAAWAAAVGGRCGPVANAYLGGKFPEGVREGWFLFDKSSWDAGRRAVECSVSRYSGENAVELTSSLR